MSYSVEIVESSSNILEVSSSVGNNPPTIEILQENVSNLSVSHDIGLLPNDFQNDTKNIIGQTLVGSSGIAISPLNSGIINIATIGLQPSGNYSLVGHNHAISDITNFSSGVSGLLPVKNIVGGTNISISENNSVFTVNVSGQLGLTAEQVDDRVSSLLKSGNYTSLNYDDENNTLTISVTGLQPSGNYSLMGHSHSSSDITNFNSSVDNLLPVKNIIAGSGIGISVLGKDFTVSVTGTFGLTGEQVDDRVSSLLKSGNYINLNYDDANDSLTISVTGLQPSGNYSLVGHSHTSNDIVNFVSAASGAAPVQSVAGKIGNVILNKNDVGLNNIDNTSDINKPVSTAQANADSAVQSAASADATTKANNAQSYAIQRSNHTGTQSSSTISDFNTSVSGLLPITNINAGSNISINKTGTTFTISTSGLQPAGNYATLVDGLIPSAQLPSYVDDVLEYASSGVFPAAGEIGKIYVTLNDNKTYRWGGTTYIEISASPGSTDNVPEGSINKYYTDARASVAAPVQSVSGRIGNIILSKDDVGLNNIDNTSDLNKPISSATQQVLDNKAPLVHTHNSNDINNFNSSVSGLLPVTNIIGNSGIVVSNNGSTYNISSTGLAYLSSANFNSLFVTGVPVSTSEHKHNYTDITNFSSGIQDNLTTTLLPGNFISIIYDNSFDTLTIGTSGVSPLIHTHTTSDITNFTSGVNSLVSGVYAPLNSPGFNGTPTAPTAASGTNTTQISTTAFVNTAINNVSGTLNSSIALKANLSGASFSGSVTAPTGNFTVLQQSGVSVSTVGHTHTSSQITDFIIAASGAAPVQSVAGKIGTVSLVKSDVGLGNVDNTSDANKPVSAAQAAADSVVQSAAATDATTKANNAQSYAIQRSNHTGTQLASTISNFNSTVSGLLPSISVGQYLLSSFNPTTNAYTISTSGLQPSGSYSLVGHTHTSSNITDFNSGVSGLLPRFSGVSYITSTFDAVQNKYSLSLNLPNCPACDSQYIVVGGGDGQLDFVTYINGFQVIPYPYSGDTFGFNSENLQDIFPIIDTAIYSRALKTHNHGNISSSGNIGSVSGLLVITGNSGILTTSSEISTSYITNFNSSVSGLLPVTNINSGSNILVSQSGTSFIVSATGLQPSGNYSLVGHTHTSSNITDFISAASGAAPVQSVAGKVGAVSLVKGDVGLSNVDNTSDSNKPVSTAQAAADTVIQNYSIQRSNHTGSQLASTISDFNSSVSGLLPVTNIVAGSNISIIPSGSIYTVSVSGQLGLTTEEVDDRVAALLVAGNGINLVYDDPNNILTVSTSGLQPSGNYSIVGHTHSANDINSGTLSDSILSAKVQSAVNLYLWSSFR